ncbi:hypothetical protein BH23BAC3_BH23BAC3_21620 [soil metagenome]
MTGKSFFSISILLFFISGLISCATTGETRVDSNQGTVSVSDLIIEQEGVLPGSFSDGKGQLFVEYPDRCYEAGIEGAVEITIDIRETGEIIDARVTRGIDEGCDEAALATIRNSEFNPAMGIDGMPMTARHIVLVTFSQ